MALTEEEELLIKKFISIVNQARVELEKDDKKVKNISFTSIIRRLFI